MLGACYLAKTPPLSKQSTLQRYVRTTKDTSFHHTQVYSAPLSIAQVTVPAELTALMSAERLGEEAHPTDSGRKICRFQQKTPIPSYLIALVVGSLESRYYKTISVLLQCIITDCVYIVSIHVVGRLALRAKCGVRQK